MRLRYGWLAWALALAHAGVGKEWSGQVVDPAGQAIAGVRVLVVAAAPETTNPLLETVSSADGTFTLSIADDLLAAAGFAYCLLIADGHALGGTSLNALEHAPEVVLETPTPLVVEVQDPDGEPLAGFPVRIAYISRQTAGLPNLLIYLPAAIDPALTAITDEQGRVRFDRLPPGASVRLEVDDDRFAKLAEWRTAGAPGAAIKLQRAGAVRGRVTYETGEPAAGAAVYYSDRSGETRLTAEVAADGRYELTRMPPGIGVLVAAPPAEHHDQWATAAEPVVELPEFNPEATVDLTLRRGVPLTITIVDDATGEPAANLAVTVLGPQWPSGAWGGAAGFRPLDDRGQAVVRVLPGEQAISYGSRDSQGRYENQPYPPPRVTVADNQPQTVELRAKRKLELPPFRGVVVDAAGQPVPEATVVIEPLDQPYRYTGGHDHQTDAEGRFEIPSGGSAQAMVTAHKGDAGTIAAVEAQPGVEVVLTLQDDARARITVLVHGLDGQPLPGARVALFRWTDRFGMQIATATSDAAGIAELPCWPHPAYTLTAKCDGYGEAQAERFAVKPGEQVTQGPLELPPADARVAGWVIGEDGQPVAGITVQINGAPHGYRRTTANAQGEFRFENIVDAAVPLSAYSSDGKLFGNATAQANDENAVITVKRRQ